MSTTIISETTPRARRRHRCYDCNMTIPIGQVHHAQTCKQDDYIYTLRSHSDCHAAALDYIAEGYAPDYEDGVPPLYEMIENGDGQYDLDAMRGHWPHVVCRIELAWLRSEMAAQKRLAEWRAARDAQRTYENQLVKKEGQSNG